MTAREDAVGDTRGDEVDAIVAAWSTVRPDVDASALHVLSRVSRLAYYLDAVRKEAFRASELEGWEFDVLAALRRAHAPMTAGALAAATDVTSGTMTNRLDRLEQRGLVQRMPDAHDRRAVRVELTTIGQERVDRALDALLVSESTVLRSLTHEQRSAMTEGLRVLLASTAVDEITAH